MITKIETGNAPRAIGPYVQATDTGQCVFVSGQIPVVPETGEFISTQISEQTTQCLRNILAILHAANLDLNAIVKTTIFVTDLALFSEVNQAYQHFFDAHHANLPARACVEVSKLPKDAKVEIDAIAWRKGV